MRKSMLAGLGVLLVVALGCGGVPRNDGAGPMPLSPTGPAVSAAEQGTTAPPAPPAPPPADKVYQGRGDKIVQLALAEGFLHVAAISHSGRSNFVVRSLDSGGGSIDLLVNEIGSYNGVRPLDFQEKPAALEIKADGAWTVTVKAAQNAPRWTGNSSGKGDAVLLVTPPSSGLTTVKVSHKGSSNFVLRSYGDRQNLLVNEIGSYSGEVLLPAGTVVMEIIADGAWTIAKS